MAKRYKCGQPGCPNTYTEVIGGDGWGGTKASGDCVPCHVASFIPEGTAIESLEANSALMELAQAVLASNGWRWQDVRDSYARGARLR